MKINAITLIKIGGMVLSAAGAVLSGIATKKDSEALIAKLFADHLKNKGEL